MPPTFRIARIETFNRSEFGKQRLELGCESVQSSPVVTGRFNADEPTQQVDHVLTAWLELGAD
jgi:hypothetical protein